MSDTTEVVQTTINKVLERVDLLASKLGIAATEVWKFTVINERVTARRDLWKSALLVLVMLPFWGWSLFVVTKPIPHEIVQNYPAGWAVGWSATSAVPCDSAGTIATKGTTDVCRINSTDPHEETQKLEDKGISLNGWLLIVTAVATFLIGLGIVIESVGGVLNALAYAKTAEYEAYKNLISDWKD
jgi:hypothetical protein